jgi:CheY-like chemotaxis protein
MSNHSILVVEDDADMQLGYDVLLRAHHYDPVLAGNSAAAIDQAHLLQPALIILDLVLPDGDGFVVLDQLQANPFLAKIPVVVVSARDGRAYQQRALAAGARAFVQKPWDDSELLALIGQLLTSPRTLPSETT